MPSKRPDYEGFVPEVVTPLAFGVLILMLLFFAAKGCAQDILTKCYDNARTCSVSNETVLTPAAVKAHGMVLQTTVPVIGDRVGMDAQPLVAAGVMNVTKETYSNDVEILPSEANIVRGVDHQTGVGLWQTPQLCVPVKSDRNNPSVNDMWHINDNFGMTATGIIDKDTGKLYQVATCSKDGSGSQASIMQRMFVLDVRTGAVLASTVVDWTTPGGQRYSDVARKPRGALGFWQRNGVKFVMLEVGSYSEYGPKAGGWLLAFDTFDNQFKAGFPTSAGLWGSGIGMVIDDDTGLIYLAAGNGPYNGMTAFGEAAIQMQFTPPTATTPAALTKLHSWALFSDSSRTCANPQLTQPKAMPGRIAGAAMPMGSPCDPSWGDQDFGLTLTLVKQGTVKRLLVGGKDGIVAAIDPDHFPDTAPADFADSKRNCAKVRLYEMAWDLGIDPCPANMAALNNFWGGKTRHIHAPIAHFVQRGVTYLLVFGENSPLQAWRMLADGTFQFVARGAEMASAGATGMHGGMPGGFTVVSSHGGEDAIGWSSVPVGDANRTITTAHLIAYDLRNLAALAGTGKLIPTLWTSAPYVYSKFATPVVSSGRVDLPNYNGGVMFWGLGQ